MLDITNFNSLINAAKQQDQPQKILVAFIEVYLPSQHNVSQAKDFLAGTGGVLKPIQLVEKDPFQLYDLNSLAEESLTEQKNWKIALIGCLSGINGLMPNSQVTKKHKDSMIHKINSGADLSRYFAFHKNGDLLQLA